MGTAVVALAAWQLATELLWWRLYGRRLGSWIIPGRSNPIPLVSRAHLDSVAIERRGVRTVKMNGRAYRGFVHVREEAVASGRELDYWVRACLEFNKRPKSSRRSSRRLTSA